MADQRLRALERRWQASGSVEDEAAWLRERVRVGDLAEERLFLAAYLGHEPARLAAPQALEAFAERLARLGGPITDTLNCFEHPPSGVLADWSAVLPEESKDVCVRVTIASCRAALLACSDLVFRARDDQVVTAIETWLLGPRTPEALRTMANYWWSHTRNHPESDDPTAWAVAWATTNAQILASYDPEGVGPAPDDPEEFERFCAESADYRGLLGDVLAGVQHALGVERTSELEAVVREELVPWLLGRGDPVADRMRTGSARSTRKPPPNPPPAGSTARRVTGPSTKLTRAKASATPQKTGPRKSTKKKPPQKETSAKSPKRGSREAPK